MTWLKRVLAVAAAGFVALAVASPVVAGGDSRIDVDEVVPALGESENAGSPLPDHVEDSDFAQIRRGTVREVARDDRATYWVARAGTSDVCLIVHLRGGHELVASSCGNIADMYRQGTGISARSGGDRAQSVEAYLVPDDVPTTEIVESTDLAVLPSDGAKLFVFHPDEESGRVTSEGRVIPRESGVEFTLAVPGADRS